MPPHTSIPQQYCDLVMKGGVTSGVIYPRVATELAKAYAFKNIGGTSAGAIAAAATAAAEYRRRHGASNEGFEMLEALPDLLGGKGFLLSLFEPSAATRPLFRALLSLTTRSHPLVIAVRVWWAAVAGHPVAAVIGAAIAAVVPVWLWWSARVGLVADGILGALWLLAGVTAFAVAATIQRVPEILRSNRFGLCSGYRAGAPIGQPPLINWLYGYLNQLAGKPGDEPLTFGDLYDATVDSDVTGTARAINLEMMTTNLTHGRPHRLPFPTNEVHQFFFAVEEWRELFPPEIITHLRARPGSTPEGLVIPSAAEGVTLCPLPEGRDLPVAVAVRLSLSFPMLFQAVPLWCVDYTRTNNQAGEPVAERCWFSDGGISSNFPIHFFDVPLPRWPTFAVDLKPPHPDHPNEEDFVWLPKGNGAGLQPRWNRFDAGDAAPQVAGFFGAIIDSMQNWRDNLEARMPGYRNRIVHISQRPQEGGLNLDMDPATIERLSGRGARAGAKLRSDFDFDNYAWVRYRSFLAAIVEAGQAFGDAFRQPVPQDKRVWPAIQGTGPNPSSSYPFTPQQQARAVALTQGVVQTLTDCPDPLLEGAPRPAPQARTVPRV